MNITTANGDPFYEDEVQSLAAAIFRRFGCDPKAATAAWRRLHENQCSQRAFMSLLRGGAVTPARAAIVLDKSG
jgi:hypothetical protein